MSSYVKNGSPEKMRTVENSNAENTVLLKKRQLGKMRTVEDSNAEKWQHGKYGIDEKQRNRDQYEIYRGLV